MKKYVFSATLLLFAIPALAATQNRTESVRNAKVWLAPAWISKDFSFSADLDVLKGPPPEPEDMNLLKRPVTCEVNERSMEKKLGGRTRKFNCELPQEKKSLIKVKYRFKNGEISGELFGTRLLWALGFAADRMFFIDKLDCFGCTEDPFKDYRIDPTSKTNPRSFELVAVERKFEGKEIKVKKLFGEYEGWSFGELMRFLPETPGSKARALVEREALRLLAIFLMHGDNKDDNQSLICLGKTNDQGGCSGETVLMIHDLGATFGKGYDPQEASKTNLQDWSNSPIWENPKRCIATMGPSHTSDLERTVIKEQGRVFLAKLLRGFVQGDAGKERVRDLFRSGRGDLRSASIEEWTEVFLRKVDEIEFPMGKANRSFTCPTRF
ncbi:hypothetical protein [Bdellovibrio bacteriovorus]|nr:hypothetical protein [Bdellovibrio bacteriovorus]